MRARVVGRVHDGASSHLGLIQRGAHLDDGAAVAGSHPVQSCPGTPHVTQVGHLGDTPELLGSDVDKAGEHSGKGHVDPHVDLAELALNAGGRRLDLFLVGHIGGDRQRRAPGLANVLRGAV